MDRLAALSKPRAIEPAEEETQIVVKKKSVKPPMPPSSTQSQHQQQPQRKRAKSKRDTSADGGGGALKKLKRKRSSSNQGSQSRGAAQINYENLLEHREKRTAAKENKMAKAAPLAIEYKVPAKDKA